jgi:hypothetical protein
LRRQKQLAEHNLMKFKEEQTEKRVGKLVLTQMNTLLANKKRTRLENEKEDTSEKDMNGAERVMPYREPEVEQEKENGTTSDSMELRPAEIVANSFANASENRERVEKAHAYAILMQKKSEAQVGGVGVGVGYSE